MGSEELKEVNEVQHFGFMVPADDGIEAELEGFGTYSIICLGY